MMHAILSPLTNTTDDKNMATINIRDNTKAHCKTGGKTKHHRHADMHYIYMYICMYAHQQLTTRVEAV